MSGPERANRGEPRERMDRRRLLPVGVWAAAILFLSQTSCVPLPVRIAPGVSGTVIDQTTGKPVGGALVVVRFDSHYDDVQEHNLCQAQ